MMMNPLSISFAAQPRYGAAKTVRQAVFPVAAFIAATMALILAAPARAQGPASLADLAERLQPSVVNISTSKTVLASRSAPQFNFPPGSRLRDLFDEFLKNRGNGNGIGGEQRRRRVRSLGSGFVIDSAGIIITNNHVIADAADAKDGEILVLFNDGTKLKADVVGRDKKTDIAVLKVKPEKPLKAVPFGDSNKLRVGDWVMAIGNPFGFGGSVSVGVVSARNRDINFGPYDNFIQTDAAINKGNSGGPLFNMAGEVVGINSAIISQSGQSVGVGFSIPASTAVGVISQLREFGTTRRGWLGVRIQTVTEEMTETLGLDEPRGALVSDVVEDAPSARAGIKTGDVIIRFDGRDIKKVRDLQRIVADTKVGKNVKVVVLRKRKELSVDVTLGRLEDGEKKLAARVAGDDQKGETGNANVERNLLGLTLSKISPDLRTKFKISKKVDGVVITKVEADSLAAERRIRAGEVILEVGQEKVSDPQQVSREVRKIRKQGLKSVLLLLSNRAGDLRFETISLKKK